MFQKAVIVGLGCIGASIGMAMRTRNLAEYIAGFDLSPDACTAAVAAGAVNETDGLKHVVPEGDLIVLAVPPSALPALFQQLTPLLNRNTILTDTAGIKQAVMDWAREDLPPDARFVPGHPIAGSEMPGITGARPDMFEDAPWILTPDESVDPHALSTVMKWVERLGAKPQLMDAKPHDEHFALLSHLPNLLANVLLRMAAERECPEIGGGSWRDLTRVGGTHPDLWTEILTYNREAVLDILSRLQADLTQIQHWLGTGQVDSLQNYLRQISSTPK